MVYAIVSAFLYLLSFPVSQYNFSLWPLVFISLVPFFASLDRTDAPLSQFARGAVWGAIMSLGMAYWLLYAAVWQYGTSVVIAVIFMIAGLALPHALVYGVFGVMYGLLKENKSRFYLFAVPSLWIIMEYARELIPLLVPWGLAGYAPQPWNLFMQTADITGLYGLSFMVVMLNGAATYLSRGMTLESAVTAVRGPGIVSRLRRLISENRLVFMVIACALIIPVAYGAVRRTMVRDEVSRELAAAKGVPITIVQPNFTQEERWRDAGFMDRVNICLGLTGRCLQDGGIVVWPETVLNSQGMVRSGLFSYIRSRMGGAQLLVAGGVRRTMGRSGVYNTAYLVSGKDGEIFYDKNVLLPYAELAPLGPVFGSFYTAPTEFLQGETPPAALTDAGTVGLSICFESVYPWHARQASASGARFLVNISNEGWFGRSSEPPLHLRQASVRAIENRRFMVRASNNGYSAVIAPDGVIDRVTGLFTRQCVTGDIVMLESKTIYTLLGDWVLYAAALLLLVLLVASLFRKR
jgi:apolipoprotein N-acyltransferase